MFVIYLPRESGLARVSGKWTSRFDQLSMPTLSRHWLVSRYCIKAFSPVSSGQVVGFFVSGGGYRGYFVVSYHPTGGTAALVPPYRFTLCVEESGTKNRNTPVSLSIPDRAKPEVSPQNNN